MLYRSIIAVCSDNHTKHINAFCQHIAEFFNVKLPDTGSILATRFKGLKVSDYGSNNPKTLRLISNHLSQNSVQNIDVRMQFKKRSFRVDKEINLPSLSTKEKPGHARN